MVQFNLLPDVKLQYVKARRTKYLMTLMSMIVSAAAISVFLFSAFIVYVVQKRSLNDLNKDIKASSQELKGTKDLDKILTVQNQLGRLTALHEGKPIAGRVFGYITQLTPATVSLNSLSVDFTEQTMELGGRAPSLDLVHVYSGTLKAADFTVEGSSQKAKAFSEVVLVSFGRDDKGATYTIKMKYNQDIFSEASKTTLIVPTGARTSEANLFSTEEVDK